MKEKRIKDVLESIAQQNVPENTNIWPRIAAKVERKNFMQTVRTRPALAMLLVLLALALFSGVAYAIGRVTGYIPGVGLVDQSTSLRILAEPVTVERDGISVTVKQVVADSDRTFVEYVVDGISIPANRPPMCYTVPFLQLPGGNSLELNDGNSGGFGGEIGTIVKFETNVSSAPIPADVDKVTFVLPCVLPEGTGPENWRIPLDLVRAPENYVTPAVELGATFVASGPKFVLKATATLAATSSPQPSALTSSVSLPHGSGLYLDKVIELPNSYILVGNFTDAGDLPGGTEVSLDDSDFDLPYIKDGKGEPVSFKVRDDIQPATTWSDQYWVHPWAYEIPKSVQGPVTITMDQIHIGVTNTTQFQFDAGSNPQIGQKWELNLPIHVGAYQYVMDSVEVVEDGYLFKYHSGKDVPEGQSLDPIILGSSPEKNAGRVISGGSRVDYSDHLTFSSLPTGQLTVELNLYESMPLQGPWTLTWTPQNP
jgi:hypothetical protein